MLKQQIRRIKKVLNILLAVLFVVSLSSAATSNTNYYTNISMSDGYTTIVSFSEGPAKIFETYTMYPNNNGADYDQVIRVENGSIYNKTNMDFVQIIHSHGSNVTDIMTINGTKVNPDDPYGDISYQTYGKIARYKEQIDEALAAYDKAIEINPQNSEAWYNKGNALDRLKKYNEAIMAYDKAIEINPKDEAVWYFKGDALRDVGKYNEAQKAYDKAFKRS
jgi:tetratricopeptide (TPR) repeat protein